MALTQHTPTELEAAGDLACLPPMSWLAASLTPTRTHAGRVRRDHVDPGFWQEVHGSHGPHALDPRGRWSDRGVIPTARSS